MNFDVTKETGPDEFETELARLRMENVRLRAALDLIYKTAAIRRRDVDLASRSFRLCSHDDCDKRARAFGLCDSHYRRWKKAQVGA